MQLPNLVPLPVYGVRVGAADDEGGTALRFDTATANRGAFALDLAAGEGAPDQTASAEQCVSWTAPRSCVGRAPVGRFVLHPEHGHTHLEGYALYELRHLDPDGDADLAPEGLVAAGPKASFCLVDSQRDRQTTDPAYASSYYMSCGSPPAGVQGISPGWRDLYTSSLPGQQVELDGVPDGDYAIVLTVDPDDRLHESDDADNTSVTAVRLSGDAARVAVVRRFDGAGAVVGGGIATRAGSTTDTRAVAVELCREVVPQRDLARGVVLARDDVFADALAGAPLTDAASCLLYTAGGPDEPLDPTTRAELDRVLAEGGAVRILGGVEAVSGTVEEELDGAGYDVERLFGATRYETAAAVARRVRAEQPGMTEVLLAYGGAFPDAVTVGAYGARTGTPIVLTDTASLHPAAAAVLSEGGTARTYVIGGTGVISETAAAAAPGHLRVAGPNRMATAADIATRLWDGERSDEVVVANLESPDAWTLALAAAPLAARGGAPVLGVGSDRYPDETAAALRALSPRPATLAVVGASDAVPSHVASAVADDVGR